MIEDRIPEELKHVLVSTDDTLSGAIRFVNTRVPVQALLDYIDAGDSLQSFFEDFPNVGIDQVQAVLSWEQRVARGLLGLDLAS